MATSTKSKMARQAGKLPSGIRKRGNRYEIHVMRDGVRRTTTAATLDDAVIARGRLLAAMGDPGKSSSKPDLASALQLAAVDWRGKWGETARVYVQQFATAMGGLDVAISDISQHQVDQYVSGLEQQGLADATINRRLAVVSKLFKVIRQRGGPAGPYIQRRKERNGRIRYLSDLEEQELLRLLRHIGRDDAADIAVVLMDTGMRMGELWAIQARDVDLSQPAVSLWRTKADLPRTIPLTTRVAEIMSRWANGVMPTQAVAPMARAKFEGSFKWVRTHMGLADDPQFVPHVLRHTFASRLVQRGASIAKVQQLLGHRTISITMRYSHMAPGHLNDAMALLEADQRAA